VTVLAVVGPTASGKSDVALRAARERQAAGIPTEIVAIDAFTVYRGMDVGTAKPSPEDRDQVPHHLVDILNPWEELSVAGFQALARGAIEEIQARGATPLLVGGSGLYWRAVVDDLRFPPTDPELRAHLEERWAEDPEGAHRDLADQDPAAAAKIDPANLRRTIRALEVIALTGELFSTFDDAWERYDSRYDDLHVAYLEPPHHDLRDRIAVRAARMVQGGLLEEAAALRRLSEPLSRTARQAIGYAEAFQALAGELDANDLVDVIARRTWRYAKRQRSWFRADPRCEQIEADQAVAAMAGVTAR